MVLVTVLLTLGVLLTVRERLAVAVSAGVTVTERVGLSDRDLDDEAVYDPE